MSEVVAQSEYAIVSSTALPFEQAVERARDELKKEGFGVLCEIDVQATLKEKLGVTREQYVILGACNPHLAHRAIEAEPNLGVLLPCNVAVYRAAGQTYIAAVDAKRMLSLVGNHKLRAIAQEVQSRLARVVGRSVAAGGG